MSKAAQASEKRKARLWWVIHQWVGLKLSLLLSFIFFTGTLAVFGHEIDWLFNPDLRVETATVEQNVNWQLIAESVAAYTPEAKLNAIDAPIDKGFAATALILTPGGIERIYVHPTTGEIKGEHAGLTFQETLRGLHRNLFMPSRIGIPIVTSISLFLAASVISSFFVYKKWWRGFFKPLRSRDARTWFGDFHRLIAVWSLWFAILLVVFGFWYFVESLGAKAPNPPRIWRQGFEQTAQQSAASLPEVLEGVREAQPGLRIKQIVFPDIHDGTYRISGQYKAVLVTPQANMVWVTGATNSVDLVVDARDLSAHQRISQMADPIHFGTFGGVWTKMVWFVFGLLMTMISISGTAIYVLRLFKTEKKTPTFRSAIVALPRGIGLAAVPTGGLVLLGIILMVRAFS